MFRVLLLTILALEMIIVGAHSFFGDIGYGKFTNLADITSVGFNRDQGINGLENFNNFDLIRG